MDATHDHMGKKTFCQFYSPSILNNEWQGHVSIRVFMGTSDTNVELSTALIYIRKEKRKNVHPFIF